MSIQSISIRQQQFDVGISTDGNSVGAGREFSGGAKNEKLPGRQNKLGESGLSSGKKEDPGFMTKDFGSGNNKVIKKHRKFIADAGSNVPTNKNLTTG